MARTTALAVQKILKLNYDGTTDLAPFIEAASAMVDDVAECAITADETLSAARLELIERWLAAHFYQAGPDLGYSSKSTAGASGQFQGETGKYLEATFYGQQAINLDSSGCLAAVGGEERRVAGGFWLGKAPSDQTDYVDRD